MTQRYTRFDMFVPIEAGLTKIEPYKLVNLKKGLRHLRDLPPDLLRLHRFCHLHCRHRRRRPDLRRQPGQSHTRPHPIRRRLRSRSHDLGAHERDSPNRTEPSLHWHLDRFCHFPGANRSGSQFCNAVMLSISDGFHWQPSTRYRRSKHQ